MSVNSVLKLVVAIAVSELAGIIGSFVTTPSIPTWYAMLHQPEFSPPNWVFAPVWTTLFLLMGIAAFLVWNKGLGRKDARIALSIFGLQLILNTAWSIIFFGQQNPGLALLEIAVLWLAILATILVFYKISRPAAYLLIPYILWVSFASYLNYSIWALNQDDAGGRTFCTQEAKLCPDGSYVGRTGPNCEFAACPGE
ncbi:MAG: TspO/MBR family protein [Candidatus Andersenbacteria bacterium]